jgi:transcriptional regulator with XRE-family HTH domain
MVGVPAQPTPAAVAEHPLRRLRRHRGLTLAVLADLSGLSGSFLSMVENGQRALTRRDHVNAVAAALRVAPAEIAPSTLRGFDEWAPSPPAPASAFPAIGDEITIARHRDLAGQFMGYVIGGDSYAAGAWLRRAARDPSVNPWLLLDRLTTSEISRRSRSRLPDTAALLEIKCEPGKRR